MSSRHVVPLCVALAAAGCVGTPVEGEREARADLARVSAEFAGADAAEAAGPPDASASLSEWLRFALLTHPEVRAAWHDWAETVEAIVPARSRPDPRFMFESDIASSVMTLMPGLMFELPAPERLRAAGAEMTARSRMARRAFERQVLRAAFDLTSAYHELHFAQESVRLARRDAELLAAVEDLARQDSSAGGATLSELIAARDALDLAAIRVANLEDAARARRARWKAALGLGPGDPDPALPARWETSTPAPEPEALLAAALRHRPELRALEEDIRRAEAGLDRARAADVPDVSIGLESDLRADPTMFRPQASVTLPIWRDKVAAEIAGAQAALRAAAARRTAEELRVAAELAGALALYRQAARDAALLHGTLLPRAEAQLELARVAWVNGRGDLRAVLDAERGLLALRLARFEARTQAELSQASLSLTIAGLPPDGTKLFEEVAP